MHSIYSSVAKGTSRAEATSNSEKIKPKQLLSYMSLKESSRQVVGQSVENSGKYIYFLICSNLLKAFWVDLKACLGLFLPNQYCSITI